MQVERQSRKGFPFKLLLTILPGMLFLAYVISYGVYWSFVLTESGSLFPVIGLVFLLISVVSAVMVFRLLRAGQRESAKLLNAGKTPIELSFNRGPDVALLVMLLALMPEIWLWMSLADGNNLKAAWVVFGLILLFASMALWSVLTPRSPMIFDREGLQFAEFWRGKLLWEDLRAVIHVEHFMGIVLSKSTDIALRKRPWYSDNARWSKSGEVLLLPRPLRYLSVPSFHLAVRERTNLKPIPSGAVERRKS